MYQILKLLKWWIVFKIIKGVFTFRIIAWILFTRRRSDTSLVRVMACRIFAPSHQLNNWWHIIEIRCEMQKHVSTNAFKMPSAKYQPFCSVILKHFLHCSMCECKRPWPLYKKLYVPVLLRNMNKHDVLRFVAKHNPRFLPGQGDRIRAWQFWSDILFSKWPTKSHDNGI